MVAARLRLSLANSSISPGVGPAEARAEEVEEVAEEEAEDEDDEFPDVDTAVTSSRTRTSCLGESMRGREKKKRLQNA